MIKYFESKYVCSGICNSALFYYSLTVELGPPQVTCLRYLKEEVGDNLTYLGVSAILAGIVMFLIWLAQYSMWCKHDDEEQTTKEKDFN